MKDTEATVSSAEFAASSPFSSAPKAEVASEVQAAITTTASTTISSSRTFENVILLVAQQPGGGGPAIIRRHGTLWILSTGFHFSSFTSFPSDGRIVDIAVNWEELSRPKAIAIRQQHHYLKLKRLDASQTWKFLFHQEDNAINQQLILQAKELIVNQMQQQKHQASNVITTERTRSTIPQNLSDEMNDESSSCAATRSAKVERRRRRGRESCSSCASDNVMSPTGRTNSVSGGTNIENDGSFPALETLVHEVEMSLGDFLLSSADDGEEDPLLSSTKNEQDQPPEDNGIVPVPPGDSDHSTSGGGALMRSQQQEEIEAPTTPAIQPLSSFQSQQQQSTHHTQKSPPPYTDVVIPTMHQQSSCVSVGSRNPPPSLLAPAPAPTSSISTSPTTHDSQPRVVVVVAPISPTSETALFVSDEEEQHQLEEGEDENNNSSDPTPMIPSFHNLRRSSANMRYGCGIREAEGLFWFDSYFDDDFDDDDMIAAFDIKNKRLSFHGFLFHLNMILWGIILILSFVCIYKRDLTNNKSDGNNNNNNRSNSNKEDDSANSGDNVLLYNIGVGLLLLAILGFIHSVGKYRIAKSTLTSFHVAVKRDGIVVIQQEHLGKAMNKLIAAIMAGLLCLDRFVQTEKHEVLIPFDQITNLNSTIDKTKITLSECIGRFWLFGMLCSCFENKSCTRGGCGVWEIKQSKVVIESLAAPSSPTATSIDPEQQQQEEEEEEEVDLNPSSSSSVTVILGLYEAARFEILVVGMKRRRRTG